MGWWVGWELVHASIVLLRLFVFVMLWKVVFFSFGYLEKIYYPLLHPNIMPHCSLNWTILCPCKMDLSSSQLGKLHLCLQAEPRRGCLYMVMSLVSEYACLSPYMKLPLLRARREFGVFVCIRACGQPSCRHPTFLKASLPLTHSLKCHPERGHLLYAWNAAAGWKGVRQQPC